MRICHYPGRAIDATLSLEQKSPMENIYKNNWLNADKTIKTIGRTSNIARHIENNAKRYNQNGKSLENVFSSESSGAQQSSSSDEEHRRNSHSSSLSRYQVTLEQMQKLDLEQSNELFQKTMRSLNGYKPSTIRQKDRRSYNDWNHEAECDTVIRPKLPIKDARHRNSEHINMDWPKQKQLTHAQSTSMPKINRSQTVRFPSSRDIKNINSMNIRNIFHQNGTEKCVDLPTATINKGFNRTKRGSRSNLVPSIDFHSIDGQTIPQFKPIPTTRANNEIKTPSQHKTLCKSVRINPTPIQNRTNENGFAPHSDNERIEQNGKDRDQRKLPRLISIMKKKTSAMRKKSAEHTTKAAPILNQWIESQKQQKLATTDKCASDGNGYIGDRQRNGISSDSKNSSTSSLSSASSNCNKSGSSNVSDFSIPRPRLIVPVHTYARRRRTGNLVQHRSGDEVNESDLSPLDRYQSMSNGNNGKNDFFERHIETRM